MAEKPMAKITSGLAKDTLQRQKIDKQLAAMADDEEYQLINLETAEAFAASDWEAHVTALTWLTECASQQ
ncbi:MAG: hypothetical protein AB1791_24065 [Chloroflexota bacterium]